MEQIKFILKSTDYDLLISKNRNSTLQITRGLFIISFIILFLIFFLVKEIPIQFLGYFCFFFPILVASTTIFYFSILSKVYIAFGFKKKILYKSLALENSTLETENNGFKYKMFCSQVDSEKHIKLGFLYFGSEYLKFSPFKFESLKDKTPNFQSPLKACEFLHTSFVIPPYLVPKSRKFLFKEFPKNVIEISSPTESAYFYVPQAKETLKKLEAIKQELLSQQDSSSDGNT